MSNSEPELSPTPTSIREWREARYGLFIHWGLYSQLAGNWQGRPIPSLGEWIMYNARIPISEYETIARTFNPVKFNAEEWVLLAKRAGMKYLVITSKHHDGFAMFDSPSQAYNLVAATPFRRDILRELAESCRTHGIKLGFYYSQAQDWHAPGGAGHWEEVGEQGWNTAPVPPEKFARYLETKVKPQLRELLTQYGPIALIWFDTPVVITREQSLALRRFVHDLQPECLVSGRVGHEVGDYGSLSDNQIPYGRVTGDWETPATMNDTWGYKADDHQWKSVDELLDLLVELSSKGVNYLLNVGPTGEGEIPAPSVERLLTMGKWMERNGAAIYATSASPFPGEFSWGRVTCKAHRLFLLISDWTPGFRLNGLLSRVVRARLLADPAQALSFRQSHDLVTDIASLDLTLPGRAPDAHFSVVELELDETPRTDPLPLQQADRAIRLPVYLANWIGPDGPRAPRLTLGGLVEGWTSPADKLVWSFKSFRAGDYEVRLVVGSPHWETLVGSGHRVTVQVGSESVSGRVTSDEKIRGPRTTHFWLAATRLGRLHLARTGAQTLELRADEIAAQVPEGLAVLSVELLFTES